jgi:hypothetical protein
MLLILACFCSVAVADDSYYGREPKDYRQEQQERKEKKQAKKEAAEKFVRDLIIADEGKSDCDCGRCNHYNGHYRSR